VLSGPWRSARPVHGTPQGLVASPARVLCVIGGSRHLDTVLA